MHGAEAGLTQAHGFAAESGRIVVGHHDRSAGIEQDFRDGQAQAAGRARHQSDLPVQIEHRRPGVRWTTLRAKRCGIRAHDR